MAVYCVSKRCAVLPLISSRLLIRFLEMGKHDLERISKPNPGTNQEGAEEWQVGVLSRMPQTKRQACG